MKAIILAAGEGKRLRPLTENIPKPMIKINNIPVLEYLILLCKKHGINEIGINISYLPEKIKEYFGNGEKWGVHLKYSFEKELLGTAGALNNFRDFIGNESFFVIYGDQITNIDLTKMLKYHNQKSGIATTAIRKKPISKPPASLIFTNENLKITKIIEKPSDELFKKLCKDFYFSNSGIYVCESEILKFIPEGFSDFAYDIFPKLIEQGEEIFSFMMDEYYFRGVDNVEKYNLCKNEIESGKVNFDLKQEKIPLSQLAKNRAIFLDKDGVINENIYEVDGKLMSPATVKQVKIIPHVREGIQNMKKLDFKIIVITNQPGIAFGYIDKEKFKEIIKYLKKELEIDEIYYCPHHIKYTGECDCRKPKIGMIKQAEKDFNLDLNNSYLVGDSLSDIKTGQNAGVKKTFRIGIVREDILELQHQKNIFPDYTLPNLVEVAKEIEKIEEKDSI